jgi:hypothetical protein
VLEGRALFDGPNYPVCVRLAEHGGRIYLDLADADWRVVEVDAEGWRIQKESPVRFRRPKGMLPLPAPVPGGSVKDLRPFVNVGSDEDWCVAVGWTVQAFRPRGPYPALILSGQQGAAKSTTARSLRALTDPNAAPLRCEPRDARDLMIAATNAWVVAFDNLSTVPPWLSDALCRLATGGGFATRELYTDAEEVLFDATRPCMLTSIEDLATRGDLLERCVLLNLSPIPEGQRRSERDFWGEFEAARPRLLGALLGAVSGALRELPGVRLEKLPRMADFAEWATAAEPALGWAAGSFLRAYAGNREEANDLALDASPVVPPLRQFIEAKRGAWEGSASDLLKELTALVEEAVARSKEWPKKANVLSGKLKRLAPNLWAAGYAVEWERKPGGGRAKVIKLSRLPRQPTKAAEGSSRPYPSSRSASNPAENGGSGGDDPRDDVRGRDDPGDDPPAGPDAGFSAARGGPRDGRDDRDDLSGDSSGDAGDREESEL